MVMINIYILIRINCSFKNKKLKNKGKRYTQRVKEHNSMGDTELIAVTPSKLERFFKLFHWQIL